MVRTGKMLEVTLPLLSELFDQLPSEAQTGAVQAALRDAYRTEVTRMLAYALAPDCRSPRIVMNDWRQAGDQWICEFWVEDTARAQKPDINWHGQDTSRWVYGGAIVVEHSRVSTHH